MDLFDLSGKVALVAGASRGLGKGMAKALSSHNAFVILVARTVKGLKETLNEIEKEGGLKLIYIDPPFAVGADFGFDIQIGGETAEKKQSIIEEIAYRDTWGKGISSYLTMMYERIKLMHSLLTEDGSIFLHCDWRVTAYLRMSSVDGLLF